MSGEVASEAVAPASAHLGSYDLAQRSFTIQIFADPPLLAWWRQQLVNVAMYQQFFGRLIEIGLEPGGVLCDTRNALKLPLNPSVRGSGTRNLSPSRRVG